MEFVYHVFSEEFANNSIMSTETSENAKRPRATNEDEDVFINMVENGPWSVTLKVELRKVISAAWHEGKRTSRCEPATVLVGLNGWFVNTRDNTLTLRYNAIIFNGTTVLHEQVRLCDKRIPNSAATFAQLQKQPCAVYVGFVPQIQVSTKANRETYLFREEVMGHPTRVKGVRTRNPFVVLKPGTSVRSAMMQLERFASCSDVDGFGVCTIMCVKGLDVKPSITASGIATRNILLAIRSGVKAKYANFPKLSEATNEQVMDGGVLLMLNPTLPPGPATSNEMVYLFTSGFAGLFPLDSPLASVVPVEDVIEFQSNIAADATPVAVTEAVFDM